MGCRALCRVHCALKWLFASSTANMLEEEPEEDLVHVDLGAANRLKAKAWAVPELRTLLCVQLRREGRPALLSVHHNSTRCRVTQELWMALQRHTYVGRGRKALDDIVGQRGSRLCPLSAKQRQ